ncbi:MAG: T9SS type A sorting domain-containing protein [Bacteroidales bacterium]|nr:T9SS type A sorting domain-containing protein [Bacteroidales bacterium]
MKEKLSKLTKKVVGSNIAKKALGFGAKAILTAAMVYGGYQNIKANQASAKPLEGFYGKHNTGYAFVGESNQQSRNYEDKTINYIDAKERNYNVKEEEANPNKKTSLNYVEKRSPKKIKPNKSLEEESSENSNTSFTSTLSTSNDYFSSPTSTNYASDDTTNEIQKKESTKKIKPNKVKEKKFPIVNKGLKNKGDSVTHKQADSLELFYVPSVNSYLNEKTSDKVRKKIMEGNSRDVTSFYGDQVLNPFAQPNVLSTNYSNPGEDNLHFYGSGDANDDGVINWTDYDLVNSGTANDRTDLDGDGSRSTTTDAQILYDYLTDQMPYLPAHWEHLTQTEKVDWFEKTLAIDQTDLIPPGPNWDCDDFAFQLCINEAGIENIENAEINFNVYDTTMNGRFNSPVYRVTTTSANNIAHRIDANLVGDNPINFEDWYFVEPQDDSQVSPGDPSMDPNEPVKIDRYSYIWSENIQQYVHGYVNAVWFNLTNGTPTVSWQHPDLVTQRPAKDFYINIGGTAPEDITIEYDQSYENSSPSMEDAGEVTGYADWATVSFSDSTNRVGTTSDSSFFNYDIFRSILAKSDSSLVIDTTYKSIDSRYGRPAQLIQVRDTETPVITQNHNGDEMFYSDWLANGFQHSTATDNSGYPELFEEQTSNQGTNPDSCNYYNFTINVSDSAVDPTGNYSLNSYNVDVVLDDTYFTFVPEDQEISYSPDLNLFPENTGGYAQATNNAGVPVGISYFDISNQDPDSTQCNHYNYSVNRIWEAQDQVCFNPPISDGQNIDISKSYSISLDSFPQDVVIGNNDPTHPDQTGWIQGTDTLVPWYPVQRPFEDEIIEATPSDTIWHRHWSMKDICDQSEDYGYQVIHKDVYLGKEDLESLLYKSDLKLPYPNPIKGGMTNFSYELKENADDVRLTVRDVLGREIEQFDLGSKEKGNHTLRKDFNNLSSGNYFVTLDVNGKPIDTEKLIKIKND